jgi:transposase
METYPRAAVERAMKVQEVIMRAMAKKITWAQAGEIIGLCERQMRRWKERYQEFGYDGLFDRRTGKPSPKRVAVATVEEVLRLYQAQYADFNVRHFHEKLREQHGIGPSYTWVKGALQMAGLVKKSRNRGVHRRRRPRRPLPGMLLHLDGSSHALQSLALSHGLRRGHSLDGRRQPAPHVALGSSCGAPARHTARVVSIAAGPY